MGKSKKLKELEKQIQELQDMQKKFNEDIEHHLRTTRLCINADLDEIKERIDIIPVSDGSVGKRYRRYADSTIAKMSKEDTIKAIKMHRYSDDFEALLEHLCTF